MEIHFISKQKLKVILIYFLEAQKLNEFLVARKWSSWRFWFAEKLIINAGRLICKFSFCFVIFYSTMLPIIICQTLKWIGSGSFFKGKLPFYFFMRLIKTLNCTNKQHQNSDQQTYQYFSYIIFICCFNICKELVLAFGNE